jgi:hypothetical protein
MGKEKKSKTKHADAAAGPSSAAAGSGLQDRLDLQRKYVVCTPDMNYYVSWMR